MKELIALMDQVQTSGAFSVGGTLPSILPGLHVNGVGPIGLPLTEHQAKALIQVSELAPYGRGEETIVDPEVRRSWQISADDFELGNPQWNEALRAAVDQIGISCWCTKRARFSPPTAIPKKSPTCLRP